MFPTLLGGRWTALRIDLMPIGVPLDVSSLFRSGTPHVSLLCPSRLLAAGARRVPSAPSTGALRARISDSNIAPSPCVCSPVARPVTRRVSRIGSALTPHVSGLLCLLLQRMCLCYLCSCSYGKTDASRLRAQPLFTHVLNIPRETPSTRENLSCIEIAGVTARNKSFPSLACGSKHLGISRGMMMKRNHVFVPLVWTPCALWSCASGGPAHVAPGT